MATLSLDRTPHVSPRRGRRIATAALAFALLLPGAVRAAPGARLDRDAVTRSLESTLTRFQGVSL